VGLLLVVSGIAAGLGLLAAAAAHWIARAFRRPRWSLAVAIITGVLVSCISFAAVFQWAQRASTTTVIGASSDVADQIMAFLGMPPGTAADFSYRRSVGGTRLVADFRMQEEDYLRWMRSQGWNPARIAKAGVTVYPVRGYDSGNELQVKQGWCYCFQKPDNPDNTETFTFDAETGRAYVRLTLW